MLFKMLEIILYNPAVTMREEICYTAVVPDISQNPRRDI